MKCIKIVLTFFFLLESFVGFAQKPQVDITPYIKGKEGCILDFIGSLYVYPEQKDNSKPFKILQFPDSLDGYAITAINDVFLGGYVQIIEFPESLRYLKADFGLELESITIPSNLYYWHVKSFVNIDSLVMPTPEKESHKFLGWKEYGEDDIVPGGASIDSISGHYYAYFEYQKDEPYTISKEDIIFFDGKLQECYYRGAKNIILPSSFCGDSVKQIYGRAFRNQDFESVVFEKGFESIGGFGWNNISQIELPEGLLKIEKQAFVGNELTEVIIPITVIRIKNEAFDSNKIEKVELSPNLRYLGGFGANELSNILLPLSLDTLGVMAFAYNNLKEIKIPKNVKVIEASAFFKNEIESIELSDALIFIGEEAFQHNVISEVIFPNNLKTLGERSFSDNKLRKVQLPQNLEYIGESCFRNNQLSQVTIPSQVVYVGEYAFANNPFPKSPPRLPEPNIEGKNFLYWKGEVFSDSEKEKVEQSNSGDIIREEVKYTAVFEE